MAERATAPQKGSSPSNPIFVAGYIQDSVPPFPIIESRGHLSFHVSGLNDPIESALLRITKWGVLANGVTSGRPASPPIRFTTNWWSGQSRSPVPSRPPVFPVRCCLPSAGVGVRTEID